MKTDKEGFLKLIQKSETINNQRLEEIVDRLIEVGNINTVGIEDLKMGIDKFLKEQEQQNSE